MKQVSETASVCVDWLRQDGHLVLSRHASVQGSDRLLALSIAPEFASARDLGRLQHEYALRDHLAPHWAAKPRRLEGENESQVLWLDDPGGELLSRLVGQPWAIDDFLKVAIGVASAIGCAHESNLIHKDVKPDHLLVDTVSGRAWLTGFGVASRLPRERQAPEPPEDIVGTLPYMAPEQTGRMNRSVDSRSDLYSMGVTLYQMLTGHLPFSAFEPLDWIHCHIARSPAPIQLGNGSLGSVPDIIMKLLAKTAEDRYQSASGVEADLQRCLDAWDERRKIPSFPLGMHDKVERLQVSECLYGRQAEIDQLYACFEAVEKNGASQVVFVSGYSGVGKSSLVNELQKVVPSRGLFAFGKFDQYKHDIPYATLAQAFQSLIQDLLTKSDADILHWRSELHEALGANGGLLVQLVPELEIIIGRQADVPELPAAEAQVRLQSVMRAFLAVFARREHPLVLFLDDLHWLDAETLALLEHLTTSHEVRNILFVGAYRANEIEAAHPLVQIFGAIRSAGVVMSEIMLAPLHVNELTRMVVDALRIDAVRAESLAHLLHDKSGGNPFYAVQFLTGLVDEGLLEYDPGLMCWMWDVEKIKAKNFADNVVDLMLGRLGGLPTPTQEALVLLACLGNTASIDMLAAALGKSEVDLHEALWDGIRAGLVLRVGNNYKFLHDRVHEAAYALLPGDRRASEHLRIGRAIHASMTESDREEQVFEIVSQINHALSLIEDGLECERFAELNLMAGRRARASSAFASACACFKAGITLLASDAWGARRDLRFELERNLGECEFMTGELLSADVRLTVLATMARSNAERASLAWLRVTLYTAMDQSPRAVQVGLRYLEELGISWSPHPTADQVESEYKLLLAQVAGRPIEDLVDLPLMKDRERHLAVDVLMAILPPAIYTDKNLLLLVLCRAANISVEHGNTDASSVAYAYLGMYLGPTFNDYAAGYSFARLGLDVLEKHGLDRFKARVYMTLGYHVMPWTKDIDDGTFSLLRRTFEAASQAGDVNYVAYYWYCMVATHLARGTDLAEAQRDAEAGLAFVMKTKFGLLIDILSTQLALIRTLRGLTPKLGCLDQPDFIETSFEAHLAGNESLEMASGMYWIRKLEARFLAGETAAALAAAANIEPRVRMTDGHLEIAEFHFYAALARAASVFPSAGNANLLHIEKVVQYLELLDVWAEHCPGNWQARALLVRAELARIQDRDLDAMRLYEQAITSAQTHGFVNNEAISWETAATFYDLRGFATTARAYFRKARDAYAQWGAQGKVRQLESRFPDLAETSAQRAASGSLSRELDLTTVLKSSQAVSAETGLEQLMQTLMLIVLQHAGADRALLILVHDDEHRIEAQAEAGAERVDVRLGDAAQTSSAMAESVLRYVVRTREIVLLDDAFMANPFSADPYIVQSRSRSILCLPLLKQSKLIGVLYLENTLTANAFTASRIAVLKVLASQAAISLQNAMLYAELQKENSERRQSEAALKRSEERYALAVQAAGDGHTDWIVATGEFYVSPRMLEMCGVPADTVITGRTDWLEKFPLHPEDRLRVLQTVEAHFASDATRLEFDLRVVVHGRTRYMRATLLCLRDVSGAVIRASTAVTDVTERLLAERALRHAQSELGRVSRLTTAGQLAVSIAHEINQPLTAIVSNASAGLNFLNRKTPDVMEGRLAFGQIQLDGKRAADVIRSLLSLSRRSTPKLMSVDINDALREVIAILQPESDRNQVKVHSELDAQSGVVAADRVQVQQVLINLIVNAMEAMVESGVVAKGVTVMSQPSNTGVVVSVRDTGPGVSDEVADKIFEPFFTTKDSGTGMGLAICRTIVEAHGSQLCLAPHGPVGAQFQFELARWESMSGISEEVATRIDPRG